MIPSSPHIPHIQQIGCSSLLSTKVDEHQVESLTTITKNHKGQSHQASHQANREKRQPTKNKSKNNLDVT
jgi:hypothetical protein